MESTQSNVSSATVNSAIDDVRRTDRGVDLRERSDDRYRDQYNDTDSKDSRYRAAGIERSTAIQSGTAAGPQDDSSCATGLAAAAAITAVLEDNRDLASFLIKRASRSDTLANYLYWYLTVESEGSHNHAPVATGTPGANAGTAGGTQTANSAGRKDNNGG